MVRMRKVSAGASMEESYESMKERIRHLTIRRAAHRRPEIEDERLWREIREAKRRFEALEKEMNSAASGPVFSACQVGHHRSCSHEVRIESHRMRCSCACHLAR